MTLDNLLSHRLPRRSILNGKYEWGNDCRWHILNSDVRLGGERIEQVSQSVPLSNAARVLRTGSGPKEKMAAGIFETLQCLPRSVQQSPLRIYQREINVHEDV